MTFISVGQFHQMFIRNMSQIDVKLGIQSILGRVNEAYASRNPVRTKILSNNNSGILLLTENFILISCYFSKKVLGSLD